MIFDALRQIASNWLGEVKPLVDTATLLHLPVTPHEVLPRQQDLETMADVSINFRLPHRITAIEDNASCVLLIDPRPDVMGLHEPRLFIDCVPLDADECSYNDSPLERALSESLKTAAASGVYAVCLGRISSPAQRAGQWLTKGEVFWVVTGTVHRQHTTATDYRTLPESLSEALSQAGMRNAMTAIEEIIAMGRVDFARP